MAQDPHQNVGGPVAGGTSWWPVLGVTVLALLLSSRPASAPGPAPAEAAVPGAGADRGRDARVPTEIPVRGWKDIAFRVYEQISEDRVLAVAAGVTFYALLAIFPTIAAVVSLYGLFADPATISKQLADLQGVIPGGALDIIGEQVKRIASKPNATLGFALAFSLAISLWSANAGMKAMFDALNVVYDEKEKRGFITLNAMSLAFTIGAILVLIAAMVAIVVLPVVFNLTGFGADIAWGISLARWPFMLIVIAAALSLLYRYGPSRHRAKWVWLSVGSAFATVAWVIGSVLFSWYVSSFGSYNATYGSLGAAIGFMTWLWISATIVLVGAEINAETEHQTRRDTTDGPEKPLGARDATMANEIGKAA